MPVGIRLFSVVHRPSPNYEGHVPLTTLERGALAIGSALGSLLNPRRGGMTFCLLPSIEKGSVVWIADDVLSICRSYRGPG